MNFDYTKRDVQASEITPIAVSRFDMDAYAEYETKLLERTAAFAAASEGVAVYLPMSFTDAQSPLNASMMIVNTNNFLMDTLINPEGVQLFLNRLADLAIDFVEKQKKMIGDCLVNPGHGFASARNFAGYGQSSDNFLMLSDEQYIQCALPAFLKLGTAFGGPVFHSCGNFSSRMNTIRAIEGLRCIDAAFSSETDPDPNPPVPFAEALAGTGIILNARIVGNLEVIEKAVRQFWRPGMKLIVVTYCQTLEEQREAYHLIHDICR